MGPAVGRVRGLGLPSVGLGYQSHDGEPEPGAASLAAALRATEALERQVDEAVRKPRPFVLHVQLDARIRLRGPKTHATLAVSERVVDEIAQRLLEPQPVALDSQPVRSAELECA